MRVLSIANFKGGTGKTLTACNLAAILAKRGRRVLLIDADPQHNATDFFGAAPEDPTLTQVLSGEAETYWEDVVSPTGRDNLWLLGADMGLLTLDLASMTEGGSEALRRFRDLINVLRNDRAFDHVVIDCPPSFTAASVAALSVSQDVIIPTKADAFSQAGTGELVTQIQQLMGAGRWMPDYHVLLTMVQATRLCREGREMLRSTFRGAVFDTEIHCSVKVEEATFARKPVGEYDPKGRAGHDYRMLADEYLRETEDENNGESV
ncbi:MAG: ParA family protein [Oscillospiraceae bacterium]|nr:ParA family protein [Oscillospiraceae bacterium]